MRAFLFLFFFYSFIGNQVFSQKSSKLSGRALFNRCYAHLTGKPMPLNNDTYDEIEEPEEALSECFKILDEARLSRASGTLVKNNQASKDILNHFYNFHRTWFPTDTIDKNGSRDRSNLLFDFTEPALYLSRAFMTNDPYTKIIGYDQVPLAIRFVKNRGVILPAPGVARVSDRVKNEYIRSTSEKSVLTQKGVLEGITWRTKQHSVDIRDTSKIHLSTRDSKVWPPNKIGYNNANYDFKLKTPGFFYNNEHFGGGIIGSPMYFAMNTSPSFGGRALAFSSSPIRIPRRWTRNLISNLLCRDLPLIRTSDVTKKWVQPRSKISFRRTPTCMRCHATMDSITSTARNIVMTRVLHTFKRDHHVYIPKMLKYDSSKEPVSIMDLTNEDLKMSVSYGGTYQVDSKYKDFNTRRPTGKLYMRSFDGKLINQDIEGLDGLASSFKDLDDLYVCAAKRYFNLFTGVNVSLSDQGDPSSSKLSNEESKYRKIVVRLGLNFKAHKNIKKLLKEIMELDLYKRTHMRLTKEDG